ncbi:hypothetical protein [Kutzneria kofuensis]|uniref:DNA-binding ferritin-like protein n=1 Tax=Kutzneria kofuensis TaxID=103725 RepID=A0A7W9KCJ2_9PSEU|nr:hypothetical protein [Kutzneria kofuensis]MBB5890100.1 DNA-binding ferritin-like protein [Kutzneria kofuensis]
MLKHLSAVLAAVLAGAVLAAIGFSVATAESATNPTTAQQITQIRDRLDAAARNNDAAAAQAAVNDLGPVLAGVHRDLDRGLVPPGTASPLAAAEKQTADLKTALAQKDGIFDSIKQMIQKLVEQLKQLLQQIFGGSTTPTTTTTTTTSPTKPTTPTPGGGAAPAPIG